MTAPADTRVSLRRMPAWYTTLFLTDLLERFGYYGMQAILVLYAAAPAARGGLGLATGDAAALFGAWISTMFLLSLPGGWVGDRVLGQRPALIAGGLIAGAGYLCLALPSGWATAIGLVLLALGGGLFKPNHQAMINMMFGGPRGRESGISLMYLGVQGSALLAPLVTGYLGERVSWHLGFSVASVAVLATALLLAVATRQFGGVGARPGRPLVAAERRSALTVTGSVVAALGVVLLVLWSTGLLRPMAGIVLTNVLALGVPVLAVVLLHRDRGLGPGDRRRLLGFVAVCLGSALFWMIIAHAASLLNLFARDHVDLRVFGFVMPASWLQGATPVFLLVLAPIVGTVLPGFGHRYPVAVKLAIGLSLVGGGFLVMAVAALLTEHGGKISPLWLALVYLMHAAGELVVVAVTVSTAADVLPRPFMGRVLGLLWLFAALGGGVGSGLVRLTAVVPEPVYYLLLGGAAAVAGVVFAVRRRALSRALTPDAPADSVTRPS
ncbi:peptide MFS transporter [Amycolatopsis sp. NPDC059027]|uniref:peptide MFS transporter n=1 Tax=unclassified Amycolatopsis TaxID=2618356 RepID=UPI00366D3755